jgi:hypothetical protein
MDGKARWWVPLVRGPLVVLRAILSPLYSLFFGWLETCLARQHEEQLAKEVRFALRFLFADGRGRIIPNQGVPFPPAFDYAFVTIQREYVLLRFSRGRGELGVNAAPTSAPSDWHPLLLVLRTIAGQEEPQRTSFGDLWAASSVLEPQWMHLTESFSSDHFDDLKHRLEPIYRHERNVMREVEFDLNSRLYGTKRT